MKQNNVTLESINKTIDALESIANGTHEVWMQRSPSESYKLFLTLLKKLQGRSNNNNILTLLGCEEIKYMSILAIEWRTSGENLSICSEQMTNQMKKVISKVNDILKNK